MKSIGILLLTTTIAYGQELFPGQRQIDNEFNMRWLEKQIQMDEIEQDRQNYDRQQRQRNLEERVRRLEEQQRRDGGGLEYWRYR